MSADPRGHVFVINGALADVDYDAVVISTSHQFGIRYHWASTLGAAWTELDEPDFRSRVRSELRPDNWTTLGWGRARTSSHETVRPTWFIDVAIDSPLNDTIHDVLDHLRGALAAIADADITVGTGRVRPLVALPVLGVGAGGFAHIAGEVIDSQLMTCEESAHALGIDIVIVAASPTDYSAFQAARRALSSEGRLAASLAPELDRTARRLATQAMDGELALFLGAGVSIGAGLPSWKELLAFLEERAGERIAGIDTEKLSLLDRAELMSVVLERSEFREAVREKVQADRYGLPHASLASLGCREVVTTNYDGLYEKAANYVSGEAITVLPFTATRADIPWLLKMHGDAHHESDLVLTRSDFENYDRSSRPMASLVQGLMITKHLLVVGASLDDDNFLRLALEVKRFRRDKGQPTVGTVVTLKPDPARSLMWETFFDFVSVSAADVSTSSQARSLAIFLDRVAMLATPARHLLDRRYDVLLGTDAERAAASALRSTFEKHADVLARPGDWAGVYAALTRAGILGQARTTSSGARDDAVSIQLRYLRAGGH